MGKLSNKLQVVWARLWSLSLGGRLEQLAEYLVMRSQSGANLNPSSSGSFFQKSYWGQDERFFIFIVRKKCLSIQFQSSTQGKLSAAIRLKPSANPLYKCKWYLNILYCAVISWMTHRTAAIIGFLLALVLVTGCTIALMILPWGDAHENDKSNVTITGLDNLIIRTRVMSGHPGVWGARRRHQQAKISSIFPNNCYKISKEKNALSLSSDIYFK